MPEATPMDRRLSPRQFKNEAELVASRTMTVDGAPVNRGDLLPASLEHGMRLRLWMSGRAIYKADYRPTPVAGDPETQETGEVIVAHTGGGWYTVKASWATEPEKVKGEKAANDRAEELRKEGPPTGPDWSGYDEDPAKWTAEQDAAFTAWYEGLEVYDDKGEAIQYEMPAHIGEVFKSRRDAAEAAELDSAGVAITEAEGGNGWYEVKAVWAEEPEKVHGIDAAKERASALRAEGPPPQE